MDQTPPQPHRNHDIERHRWTTTLAEPVPHGPSGQPAHEAGAKVSVVDLAFLPGKGNASLPVPSSFAMLFRTARGHLRRANKIQARATQIVQPKWIQPGFENRFVNEELLLDFLEELMSGVVLAHSALDSFANECLPETLSYTEDGKSYNREAIEKMGPERKLTRVLSSLLGRSNLRTSQPALYGRMIELKALRDDIVHSKLETSFAGAGDVGLEQNRIERTIFSRLLRLDPLDILDTVIDIINHYQLRDEGTDASSTRSASVQRPMQRLEPPPS